MHAPLMTRRRALAGLCATGVVCAQPLRAQEAWKIRDLYTKGLDFSPRAQDAKGERLRFGGYMAPPLKAQSRFFVLTKMPMSVCPFCETEAEWPDDILAVYTKRIVKVVPFNVPITVEGQLELGGFTDPDTGFVSRVRLSDAVLR